MRTLKDMRPGETGRVKQLTGEGAIFQRLCEMGFVEGAPLRVVRFAPLGDPLEVQIHDCHLSLRRAEASMVVIEEPARLAAGGGTLDPMRR